MKPLKFTCIFLLGYIGIAHGIDIADKMTCKPVTINSINPDILTPPLQLALDKTHNGYWMITGHELYFFDNNNQEKLDVIYNGIGYGVTTFNNDSILLLSALSSYYITGIYAYDLNAVYEQGIAATAENKYINIDNKSQCINCSKTSLPHSGNAGGMAYVYADTNNYVYGLYVGYGRQIYTWSYDQHSDKWIAKGWLDNSYDIVFNIANPSNMVFYNNQFQYVPYNANNIYTTCSEISCTVHYDGNISNMNKPLSFIHESLFCNIDGVLPRNHYPLKAICADNSQFEIYSTDNLKFGSDISDIVYNPSNHKTYILSDKNLYQCK